MHSSGLYLPSSFCVSKFQVYFIDIVQFAVNLLVTRGRAMGFTLRNYGDGVCGGAPSQYGGLKTLSTFTMALKSVDLGTFLQCKTPGSTPGCFSGCIRG